MPANDQVCDKTDSQVDAPCGQNLHDTPHPISTDPRPDCRDEPGSAHEHVPHGKHIPAPRTYGTTDEMLEDNSEDEHEYPKMKCCCGRPDCAYLEHNNTALGGLEKNLETAARLGQALLSRHESYISDSQAEQARLSACISALEIERTSLQNANERMAAENRELLHKLEHLNESLADSDHEVRRLERLLLDCEAEVKKLNAFVRRAEELEKRLQEMETERQSLNQELEDGRDETRSMLTRWKESERKVRELEEEVRRIEREARLDREKHEEMVTRFEKERSLERELGGAEGRLKGAAAIQSMSKNDTGSKTVVSHFVKDILQDNANLQAGIAELRQLLQASNEEVQNLREQILLHQPIVTPDDGERQMQRTLSLDQELGSDLPTSPKQVQPEVHVHHHYHAKPSKNRVTTIRRPSRRRSLASRNGDASDSSVPATPVTKRFNSSPVVPLNLHQSQNQKNRWSMQSTATMSSVLSSIPSSPRSYFERGGSIFDRLEQGEESSRPTSPESAGDLLSPGPGQWRFRRDVGNLDACEEEDSPKETFEMSPLLESKPGLNSQEPPRDSDDRETVDQELTPKPSIMLQAGADEANKIGDDAAAAPSADPGPPVPEPQTAVEEPPFGPEPSGLMINIPEIRPVLARKGSHETLVSISGMDIHIPQRVSPATTLDLLHRHFAHSPAQSRKVSAAQPLASVTEYTAVSTPAVAKAVHSNEAQRGVPSSVEALSGIAVPRPRVERDSSQASAIGRLGGWVRGKWGVAPTKSIGNLRSVSASQASTNMASPSSSQQDVVSDDGSTGTSVVEVSVGDTEAISIPERTARSPVQSPVDPSMLFAGRSPGVNQPGFIPGLRAVMLNKRTPSQVMASVIDEEGLQEGLAELTKSR